jgi:KUP system potassium uptake protein
MAITTLLFHVIATEQWEWPTWKASLASGTFLFVDLAFFGANVLKVEQGGWVPLAIGVALFTLMRTWKEGRRILWEMLQGRTLPMSMFIEDVGRRKPARVPGTAVFMTSTSEGAPVVLLHHLKHNKVLHEQVVLMSVVTAEVPEIPADERVKVTAEGHGFFRVVARYGFMETPDVPEVLELCQTRGLRTRPGDTSFYLGRERLIPTGDSRMSGWRKKLFIFMSRNARSATEFFGLPPNRVVELGTQIEF